MQKANFQLLTPNKEMIVVAANVKHIVVFAMEDFTEWRPTNMRLHEFRVGQSFKMSLFNHGSIRVDSVGWSICISI